MKKFKPTRRLLGYSCLATSFLALGQEGDAQVLFYDYTPDSLIQVQFEGPSYTSTYGLTTGVLRTAMVDLDLDRDGVADASISFRFNFDSSDSVGGGKRKILAKPGVDLEFAANFYAANNFAYGALIGAAIDENLNWGYSTAVFNRVAIGVSTTYEFGNWDGTAVRSLAFRFGNGAGDYLYGWLRFASSGGGWFSGPVGTLVSYAMSFDPNAPILAGIEPATGTCDVSSALNASPLSSSSVQLSWTPDADNFRTQLQGRASGAANFKNLFSFPNMRTVNGLTPGGSYEWKARSFCNNGLVSDMSLLQSFTMPVLKTPAPDLAAENALAASLKSYVHAGELYVSAEEGISEVVVFNMAGMEVSAMTVNARQTVVGNLAPGIYVISVRQGETTTWRKVVI